MMDQPRIIGHVVSVNGFRLKVELSDQAKSPSRATPDGIRRAVAINSYLTFDLGAGSFAVGILSDLEAREAYDPAFDSELALELTKPRRIATVQLLGTVHRNPENQWTFDVGITMLPTLDTPAEITEPEILIAIFGHPPERNKPREFKNGEFDHALDIGHLSGDENTIIKASFNDLFARPLAIVGNTGSGKSYTVASLLRNLIEDKTFKSNNTDPHIFVLDINGEYANALLEQKDSSDRREPNKIYLNGEEFSIPAWFMNGEEICDWLQASEATQEPVLKDWWAIAKSDTRLEGTYDPLQMAIVKIEQAIAWLDSKAPNTNFHLNVEHAAQYANSLDWEAFKASCNWSASDDPEWSKIQNEREVRDSLENFKAELLEQVFRRQHEGNNFAKSTDAPRFVPYNTFRDPKLVDRSSDHESNKRIDQYLLTLKLRMRTRIDDRRWQAFFSYEDQGIRSFEEWMNKLGIGQKTGPRICVMDLSMLATETLPFACAILGRMFLEARELLKPDSRNEYPWVLVLEEAHNYVRPRHLNEDRSLTLSRQAFERVAKEGRKFGLSLIVASQRPSEISPTIISQCANFISHRLQNPDDIDHFRRIIPKQAQRLLDQVTVLAAGEAIMFGSAVHVPSRVQIKPPSQEPWSATAAPFVDWKKQNRFPLNEVVGNWGLIENNANNDEGTSSSNDENSQPEENVTTNSDDTANPDKDDNEDIPF